LLAVLSWPAGDPRHEHVDVVDGAVKTTIVGAFIVIGCAATPYEDGQHVDDVRDAAVAPRPPAGGAATTLFGLGLVGAALLAAAIVPRSSPQPAA